MRSWNRLLCMKIQIINHSNIMQLGECKPVNHPTKVWVQDGETWARGAPWAFPRAYLKLAGFLKEGFLKENKQWREGDYFHVSMFSR